MIRVNVSLIIENAEKTEDVLQDALELAALSLHDKGVIDYDVYRSLSNDDRVMIYETWNSKEDLERHMHSDHFKRLVPKLQEAGNMTIQQFDF